MRSSLWRGHLRGICWQRVAETRVSGSGKVCALGCTISCLVSASLRKWWFFFSPFFDSQWMKTTSTSVLPLWTLTHRTSRISCGTRPRRWVPLCSVHLNGISQMYLTMNFPDVCTAPRVGQLRQQRLYLQGRGWRLGVPGHLARTHVHSVESRFWCHRAETCLLQRRPHREDLERVSQWKRTRFVFLKQSSLAGREVT